MIFFFLDYLTNLLYRLPRFISTIKHEIFTTLLVLELRSRELPSKQIVWFTQRKIRSRKLESLFPKIFRTVQDKPVPFWLQILKNLMNEKLSPKKKFFFSLQKTTLFFDRKDRKSTFFYIYKWWSFWKFFFLK